MRDVFVCLVNNLVKINRNLNIVIKFLSPFTGVEIDLTRMEKEREGEGEKNQGREKNAISTT